MASGYETRLVDPLLDELLAQLPGLLIVGPRAVGKSTTASRRANTVIDLDRDADAAAFEADPDVALRDLEEPVLLDEWQSVPGALGAVRRAISGNPEPNRFLVSGSVNAELFNKVWPGTGRLQRVTIYPMTIREQVGEITGPTFFDKLVSGDQLSIPPDTPDLAGYIDMALRGGFPPPALRLSGRPRSTWLASYIDDLLTHDVQLADEVALHGEAARRLRSRDTQRLRRYFEACALNSAGVTDHKAVYDRAQVNRATALAYERLLTDLFIIDQIPAWATNRFRRLVGQPKRYLIDSSLIGTALRVDRQGVIRDGDLLGRLVDTFVAAQLRPEIAISESEPRLYHLRTKQGREEVDLIAELAGDRVIGIEMKAGSSPGRGDAKHLLWLRDQLGSRFVRGVVFHTGPRLFEIDDKVVAAPISTLWG